MGTIQPLDLTDSMDPEILDLLGDLARMGVQIWTERGALRYRIPSTATVGALALRIEDQKHGLSKVCRDKPDDLLFPLRSDPQSDYNIICIHPITGGVYEYRHFAKLAPPGSSVYGLQALLRLLRVVEGEMPLSFEQMVNLYSSHLLGSKVLESPFVLYGASSGGTLALEIARILDEHGKAPVLVVLGDTIDTLDMRQRSSLPAGDEFSKLTERFLWMSFIEFCMPLELLDVTPRSHSFWGLAEKQRIEYLIERIGSSQSPMHLVPADVGSAFHWLEVFRQYFYSYALHAPGAYHRKAVYFKASNVGSNLSTRLRSQLLGNSSVVTFKGGHPAIFQPPACGQVSHVIWQEVTSPRADPTNDASELPEA